MDDGKLRPVRLLIDLPFETLVKIFSFLSLSDRFHGSQVCKKLYTVFSCSELWVSFTFAFGHSVYINPTPSRVVENLLRKHSTNLRRIKVHAEDSPQSAQEVCQLLTSLCNVSKLTGLRVLSSPGCGEVPYEADRFSSAIARLIRNSARMPVCEISNTPAGDEACESLAKHASTTLRELQILQCHRISQSGVFQVAKYCTNLAVLTVHYSRLSSDSLLAMSHKDHAPVTHLRIDVVSGENISHEIGNKPWAQLMESSKALKFSVNFFCLSDKQFDVFFNCKTPVTYLSAHQSFSKSFLKRVSVNCPFLEKLSITGTCSDLDDNADDEIVQIARNCHKLKSIVLSGFYITCFALERIASERGSSLQYFSVEDNFIEGDLDSQEVMQNQVSKFVGRDWSPIPSPFYY